jgi:4a-hydroxytetrahydrobiopterin dehydratase
MDLTSERCTPRSQSVPPFTRREIFDLLPQVSDWLLKDGHLIQIFEFRTFSECLQFVQGLAAFAASEEHYPDIAICRGREVTVSWYTYASGGLTRNDFIMAARLSHKLASHQGGAI